MICIISILVPGPIHKFFLYLDQRQTKNIDFSEFFSIYECALELGHNFLIRKLLAKNGAPNYHHCVILSRWFSIQGQRNVRECEGPLPYFGRLFNPIPIGGGGRLCPPPVPPTQTCPQHFFLHSGGPATNKKFGENTRYNFWAQMDHPIVKLLDR